ncbi:MAG: lyase family protein, partial [Pseudomonadota bacterium]
MWGGRFADGPAAVMRDINASIDIDKRLWREDIRGSKAHARMLAATGILSAADAQAIEQGLTTIAGEIDRGDFGFSADLEDIHMNIEARLIELVGEAGRRLHTARSRNDQVATDFRMWTRNACADAASALADLQRALVVQAEAGAD